MKYLQNLTLETLNSALTIVHGDVRVTCRLESYSCKMAGDDKRLFKKRSKEEDQKSLVMLSAPKTVAGSSYTSSPLSNFCTSFGSTGEAGEEYPQNSVSDLKTMYYLISTLNAAFYPDYDFSGASSEEFSKEPNVDIVKNYINCNLSASLSEKYDKLSEELWQAIDAEITLSNCNVYSYNHSQEFNPFVDEGNMWTFNFFFHNCKQKRMLFFTCKAQSLSVLQSEPEGFQMAQEDEYYDVNDSFDGNVPLMF